MHKILYALGCAVVLPFSLSLFMGCGGEIYIPAGGSDTDPAGDSGPSAGNGVDGGTVLDGDPDLDDGSCTDDTVAVCHAPNGNPDAAHVICVSQTAADALLEHGDTLGACPE